MHLLVICLRLFDLLLAGHQSRGGFFQVVIQFRNLKHGQHLARLDVVPDVHVDGLDITRDFRIAR